MPKLIRLKQKRQGLGYTGQEFCDLMRPLCPHLTLSRLRLIESGRLPLKPNEKDLIAKFFQCPMCEL